MGFAQGGSGTHRNPSHIIDHRAAVPVDAIAHLGGGLPPLRQPYTRGRPAPSDTPTAINHHMQDSVSRPWFS